MRCIQEFYWNNINIISMKTSFVKSIRKSARYWFIPLIVGILFIILGGYTIATPLKSYLALAVLFSLSFLVTGTSEVIFAFVNRKEIENWGWSLSLGIITAIIRGPAYYQSRGFISYTAFLRRLSSAYPIHWSHWFCT